MGTSLTGLTPSTTYDGLIKLSDNEPLGATAKYIGDGLGNDSVLSLSTTKVGIGTSTPTAQTHIKGSGTTSATTSLLVQNSAGLPNLTVSDGRQVAIASSAQLCCNVSGVIDSNDGLRLLSNSSGTSYIDGYSEGTAKGQNYAIIIGSRVNNTGISRTGSTGAENGSQVFFGSELIAASAQMGVNSTTRGFLPPRMTTTQKNAIASPAAGLMVYDSTLNKLCVYTTAWETITSI